MEPPTVRPISDDSDDSTHLLQNNCDGGRQASFCTRYRKVLVILPFIVLNAISNIMIRPILPGLMKDFFDGSDKRAAEVVSYIAAVMAFIGLFTASFYGRLLDTWGRKLFFVLVPLFQNFIPVVLLFISRDSFPLVYPIANGIGTLIQASYQNSYVADHFSEHVRVKVFAGLFAVATLSNFFGVFVHLMDNTMCMVVSLVCSGIATLYAKFCIQESFGTSCVDGVDVEACEISHGTEQESFGPFDALKFLLSTPLCRLCVGITACFMFAAIGTQDIYMYYLNDRVQFSRSDNGFLFAEIGILTPIVMLVLLPSLTKRLPPHQIMYLGLATVIGYLLLVAFIWAVWVLFAIILPLACFAMMMMPLTTSIIANAGHKDDQGRRLTGYAAITDLCNALGPLVFGALYGNLYGPYAKTPFLLAAVFCLPALIAASNIPRYLNTEEHSSVNETAEEVV